MTLDEMHLRPRKPATETSSSIASCFTGMTDKRKDCLLLVQMIAVNHEGMYFPCAFVGNEEY